MKYCQRFCAAALLSLVLSPAWASLTPTIQFSAEPERAPLQANREARQRVTEQLIELGVEPAMAAERVQQMTGSEIANLQNGIASLPAGAGIDTTNLLLIIIILILLL